MNATMWFQCKASPLKSCVETNVKTIKEIASCMIFNCIRENGPPVILEPILFAGIMKQYSNRANPQEQRIIR